MALRSNVRLNSLINDEQVGMGRRGSMVRFMVRFKRPKVVAGAFSDLKRHINSTQAVGKLIAGVGVAAAACLYPLLMKSPCEMLLQGGPTSHIYSLAKNVGLDGRYFPREKDARELYEKIQEANSSYIFLYGPEGTGKSELLKEMRASVNAGVIYMDHYYFGRTASVVLWELGCYLRSVLLRSQDFVPLLPESWYVDSVTKSVFGRNGVLYRASKEFQKRTGKKVICVLDNLADGSSWSQLVNPLVELLEDDSPFCLVFVAFGNPGGDKVMECILPSTQELEAYLSQAYKLTPQVSKEIAASPNLDLRQLLWLASIYETRGEDWYRSQRNVMLKSGSMYQNKVVFEKPT